METMRGALVKGDEENPRKATVESVLPGVHQQFTNLYHEISRVRNAVDDLKTIATTALDEDKMRELLDSHSHSMKMVLASQFVTVGLGLATQGSPQRQTLPSKAPGSPMSPASVPSPSRPTTITHTNDDDDCPILRLELKCRNQPKSCTAIYHEFHGIGEFEGIPIDGGLAAMDGRYKTKWRSGDKAYQKAFSRMQQISKAVSVEMEKGRTMLEVLLEFDELFVTNQCKGLEHMRLLLDYIIPKRERRRKSVGRNEAHLPV